MSRSLLGELERAHGIAEALQATDPKVLVGDDAAGFAFALDRAVMHLSTCLDMMVRASRANRTNARSESTAEAEISVTEPHQASVGSDEPHQ